MYEYLYFFFVFVQMWIIFSTFVPMKAFLRFLICFSVLLLPSFRAAAQPTCTFTWYNSQGNPSLKTIHQISQDKDGFLWLATWDGLLRFDGLEFKRFLLPQGSQTNRFTFLTCDPSGHVWTLAYDSRLYRFDPQEERFETVDTSGGLVSLCLRQDERTLLVHCNDGRYFRIDLFESDPAAAVKLFSPPFPQSATLLSTFTDSAGTDWFLTDNGVFSEDGANPFPDPAFCATEIRGALFFGSQAGTIIIQDQNRTVRHRLPTAADITAFASVGGEGYLAGTRDAEAFLLTPDFKVRSRYSLPSSQQGPAQTLQDIDGRLWMYSPFGGMDLYDPASGRLQPFFDPGSQVSWNSENRITAVFSDRQGILWTGTNWNGLQKAVFQPDRFELTRVGKAPETSAESSVRSLFEDRARRIWVGTKDNRMHLYGPGMQYLGDLFLDGSVRPAPGDAIGSIYAIAGDRDGTIWMGSRFSGLLSLQPVSAEGSRLPRYTVRHFPKDADSHYGLNGEQIFSLHIDREKRLWIASFDDGLSYLDLNDPEYRFFSKKNRFSFPTEDKNRLRYVTSTPDGRLLTCGTLGLFVCENPHAGPEDLSFRNYLIQGNDQVSVASDMQHILPTPDGRIYVCSYGGGFNQFCPDGSFKPVGPRDGILSNFTLSAVQDSTGVIWIATDEGLNRFDPVMEIVESFPYKRIGNNFRFNEGTPLYASDGEIYFGTTDGVLHFDPAKISNSSYVPDIRLMATASGGRGVSGRVADGAKLTAGQELDIAFQAMDMTDPARILYQCQLPGQETWTQLGRDRHVKLSSLRKGNYVFRVRSTNGSGREVENEAQFHFTVRPRRGLSPGAFVLYGVLLAAGLTLFFWFRYRKRQQEEPFYGSLQGADRVFIHELVTFLRDNLDNPDLDVPMMAAHMNVSRSLLFERTKTLLDRSPASLLREIRFDRVRELIREGGQTLAQIADMTGFNDPNYLSASFKRQFGESPSEYKNRFKK